MKQSIPCQVFISFFISLESIHRVVACIPGDGITCPTPTPPNPCANNNCNNGGNCEVEDGAAVCVCEDTFENTPSLDSCVCPEGTTRTTMNRCVGPPTVSPSNIVTDLPTTSIPSPVPSFSPTIYNENTGYTCKDNSLFQFFLGSNGNSVGCDWLTKNSDKIDTRIANYCGRADVQGACQSTCNNCDCGDDENFIFTLPSGPKVGCTYIIQNSNKIDSRRNSLCYADTECREATSIGVACTAACGFCDGTSTSTCARTDAPTKSPTLCASSPSTNTAPSKGYCGKGKGKAANRKVRGRQRRR